MSKRESQSLRSNDEFLLIHPHVKVNQEKDDGDKRKKLKTESDKSIKSYVETGDQLLAGSSKKLEFVVDLRKKINQAEDQDQTEKLFTKIRVDETISGVLVLMGICSSIIYYQMKSFYMNEQNSKVKPLSHYDYAINLSLIFTTICNVLYSKSYNYVKLFPLYLGITTIIFSINLPNIYWNQTLFSTLVTANLSKPQSRSS